MVLGIFRSKIEFSSFQKTCKYWPSSTLLLGFGSGSAGKESACSAGVLGSIPGLERSSWRRESLPTPVFWPGKFHGLHSPWDHKESDMTEQLSFFKVLKDNYCRPGKVLKEHLKCFCIVQYKTIQDFCVVQEGDTEIDSLHTLLR